MSRLRVHAFSISIDGYGAGPAQNLDNPLGGGVTTIKQYLHAQLIDELHLAISPVLLGSGEHLMTGVNMVELGYDCTKYVPTPNVTHVVLSKRN